MVKSALRRGARRLSPDVQARMGGLYTAIVRRTPNRTRYEAPLFRREFDGTVQYVLSSTGLTPRDNKHDTLDIFCWCYTPGEGDVVVDIGAGTGEETVTFSRLVGATGTVVSIEAHPDVHLALQRTVQANRLDNCIPVQAAVGATAGRIDIESDTLDWVSNSVHTGHLATTVSVPLMRLQDVLDAAGVSKKTIDFLKINIEGAEADVLAEATGVLERVQNIAVSCHDFKAQRTGDPAFRTYTKVQEILGEAHFALTSRADRRPWVADVVYGSRP